MFNIFGTHTYADEGTSKISVLVDDIGGESATVLNSANIADAPLSPGVGTQIQAVEGKAGSLQLVTFNDGNPSAPASDFSGTIFWGDGTTSAFTSADVALVSRTTTQATFSVTASHTYAEDGIYIGTKDNPIQVVVNDVGGQTTVVGFSAYVADAPLHGAGVTISAQTENVGFTGLKIATFSDEDPAGFRPTMR